jgi:hypothetical protein
MHKANSYSFIMHSMWQVMQTTGDAGISGLLIVHVPPGSCLSSAVDHRPMTAIASTSIDVSS